MIKKTLVLLVLLALLVLPTACQKNYNDYRNLVYGKWCLVSVDGVTDTTLFAQDTLAFTTSTAVKLTRSKTSYIGQYSFYTNILTTYFSTNTNLYQEWLVEKMKDSFMRAVVQIKLVDDVEETPGSVLEYVKLP